MMAWCKTIGKRRELCMDTSVSYIAKPRGAIAFVIKLTAVFLQMASPLTHTVSAKTNQRRHRRSVKGAMLEGWQAAGLARGRAVSYLFAKEEQQVLQV